jgi:hypothetical protein
MMEWKRKAEDFETARAELYIDKARSLQRTAPTSAASTSDRHLNFMLNRNLPPGYAEVFEWTRDTLVTEYNRLYDKIEALQIFIDSNLALFNRLRALRKAYVAHHGIERWSAVPESESHHLKWKAEVFGKIEQRVLELKEQQKQLKELTSQLKLVSCVLNGAHPTLESLSNARSHFSSHPGWRVSLEKLLASHLGIIPTNRSPRSYYDPDWSIGPRVLWEDEALKDEDGESPEEE